MLYVMADRSLFQLRLSQRSRFWYQGIPPSTSLGVLRIPCLQTHSAPMAERPNPASDWIIRKSCVISLFRTNTNTFDQFPLIYIYHGLLAWVYLYYVLHQTICNWLLRILQQLWTMTDNNFFGLWHTITILGHDERATKDWRGTRLQLLPTAFLIVWTTLKQNQKN